MSSNPETTDFSDQETDPGYRSRSQSRRARRRKQTGKPKKNPMPPVPENKQASAESQAVAKQDGPSAQSSAQAQQPQQSEENTMQPFEWIGPDSTSMDGPVTYAKAMRGEIPMRPGNPNQALKTADKGGGGDAMMDQDGLKLRIELNIDVEIELKARIQGDLTLALL